MKGDIAPRGTDIIAQPFHRRRLAAAVRMRPGQHRPQGRNLVNRRLV
jgi:hypothetical protein